MSRDLVTLMHLLGPEFAARAARSDSEDLFVAENYVTLKSHGVLKAVLPVELDGGGAPHRELGEMLRVLARYCGSTALALSMHIHQAATAVWRWRRDPLPLEALLRCRLERPGPRQQWRLGLDRWIRQGGARRERLAHHRAQDFRQRRSGR
jgi:alkylation response protein AidB-like acyl-CoA dehydrogenase